MNPELSHRLGYLINQVDLNAAQETYIQDICEQAGSFDQLPIEVQIWFSDNEREFGIHPEYEEIVGQRVQDMLDQIEPSEEPQQAPTSQEAN